MGSGTHTVVDMTNGPGININVDANAAHERGCLVDVLREIFDTIHPPAVYNPKQIEFDEFGTPTVIFETPSFIDKHHSEFNMIRQQISPMSMLYMRMRWGSFGDVTEYGAEKPFPVDHLSIHKNEQKVFVFVVVRGQAATIEDDPANFPSDALVTQLRMITEEKASAQV